MLQSTDMVVNRIADRVNMIYSSADAKKEITACESVNTPAAA